MVNGIQDDSIAAPGLAHRAMATELGLIADLMGGTASMRRAGQRWLPREASESWTAWRARLQRSVLFNGLSRTIQALAGRPFARPVALADAHDDLLQLATNIDGRGTALGSFAAALLRALLRDGIVHVLIDRPQHGGRPISFWCRHLHRLARARIPMVCPKYAFARYSDNGSASMAKRRSRLCDGSTGRDGHYGAQGAPDGMRTAKVSMASDGCRW